MARKNFDTSGNTIRHVVDTHDIIVNRAEGFVPNILATNEDGYQSFIGGHGTTMKQARSEARAWLARYRRQSGPYDKITD